MMEFDDPQNGLKIENAVDSKLDPLILISKSDFTLELDPQDAARVGIVLLVSSISSICTAWLAKLLGDHGVELQDIQQALLIFNTYIHHQENQINPYKHRTLSEAFDVLCDQDFRKELGHICAVGVTTILSSHFEFDDQMVGDALDGLHLHLKGIVPIWPQKRQFFDPLSITLEVENSRIKMTVKNTGKKPEIIAGKVLEVKLNHDPDDVMGCNIYPQNDDIFWFILPCMRIKSGQEISCSWATTSPNPSVHVLGLSFGEEAMA